MPHALAFLMGLCLLMGSSPSHADSGVDPILLASEHTRVALDGRFSYAAEPDGPSAVDTLLGDPRIRWHPAPPGTLNLGFRSGAYWLRIPLQIASGGPSWVLELGSPTLAHAEFYVVQRGHILLRRDAGDHLALGARPSPHEVPVFALPQIDGPFWVYLRVHSQTSMQLPLTAWQPAAYSLHVQRWTLLQGGFVGALLVMALYNLVLYFGTRDRSYLFYVLFVVLGLILQARYRGFDALLLPPDITHVGPPS